MNLICNGMLAYYWEVNKQEDSFRILVPQTGNGAHVVKFGGIGGDSLAGGQYRLELPGHAERPGDPFPKGNSKDDLIFGRDDSGHYTKPSLKANRSGVFAEIILHKPSDVVRARIIKRKQPNDDHKRFFEGDALDFGINPDQIPGVYVLTYLNVTGPVRLVSTTGLNSSPHEFSPQPVVLNIHLYSERPPVSQNMDHIELFNAMFIRSDNAAALHMAHDPAKDAEGFLTPLASEDPGLELSRYDIATLVELDDVLAKRGDPAGCADAWVYTSI